MKLYVKKVYSWNPIKYEYIPLEKALKNYRFYIECYVAGETIDNPSGIKTFEQWLTTEI